ncbi:hypothetical protein ACWZEH_21695 [Streptomyces sp. QTS137]
MGERRNGGGAPGRRREHPEATSQGSASTSTSFSVPASGRSPARDAAALDAVGPDAVGIGAMLAGALTRDGVDAGAEQRAVAAFREARSAGAHRTRTRRRDDWRPRERRLGRFSARATLSVLVAGLGLGGVAVAGIGGAVTDTEGFRGGGGRPTTPAGTFAPWSGEPSAGRPGTAGPDAGSGPAAPERPLRARNTEAHCRAYEKLEGRGNALDPAAWKRLVDAAGGADNVDAHCAGQPRSAPSGSQPGGAGASGDRTGDAGDSGIGSSGAGNGAGEAAGNGAGGRQGASARPDGGKKP